MSIFCGEIMVDLIGKDIMDFDMILGMDFLNSCYDFLYYRAQNVTFHFPNKSVIE